MKDENEEKESNAMSEEEKSAYKKGWHDALASALNLAGGIEWSKRQNFMEAVYNCPKDAFIELKAYEAAHEVIHAIAYLATTSAEGEGK